MGKILENTKYVVILGIISLLFASVISFLWGGIKTFSVTIEIINSAGKDPKISIALIEVIDSILISVALFIFAASLYQLFIGKLNLPPWMLADNLYDLKAKLGSMIILVIAVKFLEHLVEWKDPSGTLYFGIAVAVVSGILVAFSYFSKTN